MSDTKETVGGEFIVGLIVGVLIMLIVTVAILQGANRIVSSTKLIPETQLTTDGKVIDTLYIYTEK